MLNKVNVGVTFGFRGPEQSFWENGLLQNCIFLIKMLKKITFVNEAYLVIDGPGKVEDLVKLLDGLDVKHMPIQDAFNTLQVVIEMGVTLQGEWVNAFRTHKNGVMISARVGNDYEIDLTLMLYERQSCLLYMNCQYDKIWILPQYDGIINDYYEIGYNSPIEVLPHMWSPLFIEREYKRLPQFKRLDYTPGKTKWKLGILEANTYLIKTFLTPLLIAEYYYRQYPDNVDVVNVYNMATVIKHLTFKHFVAKLKLFQDKKIQFLGRYVLPSQKDNIDVIISHQANNPQNYLYYEALYSNIPLIHNSDIYKDYGYYYNGYNAKEGAIQLKLAFDNYDKDLELVSKQNKHLVENILNPEHSSLVAKYANSLKDILVSRNIIRR